MRNKRTREDTNSPAHALIPLFRNHFGKSPIHGVEVGVYLAHTTTKLLDALPGLKITCVDTWSQNYPIAKMEDATQEEHDDLYRIATQKLDPFGDRVSVVRLPSLNAAKAIDDQSVDFVFIDADHSRKAVAADLNAWYPKVRESGIIACHDYGGPIKGVSKAFDEFTTNQKLPLPTKLSRRVAYVVKPSKAQS